MVKIPEFIGSIANANKSFSKAKTKYEEWRSMFQDAFDYSMPDRETFRRHSPGNERNRQVYDYTATEGIEVFANKIQHGFFPPWMNWLKFEAGRFVPEDQSFDMDEKLEEGEQVFFDNLHSSNFSTEITPSLKDYAVSAGCIEAEAGRLGNLNDPLFHFIYIPLSEIYPVAPPYGPVKSSWREHKVEAGHILITWPKAELPNTLKTLIKKEPTTLVNIKNGHICDYKTGKYHQLIIYEDELIYTQVFNTCRRIYFRPSVTAGETAGRGPIIRVLPAIRTANKMCQFSLQHAALQMAGMFTGVDDGIFNPSTVRIVPGNVIPVASNNSQNPTLSRVPSAGDIGLGELRLEDLRDAINVALFSSPLGETGDPVKSAAEQMLRHQDDMKRSGTSFGRLYSELIQPLVYACIDIMKIRGEFPDIKVDGKEVKIRLESPLAKQKELEEFQNIQIWLQAMQLIDPQMALIGAKQEAIPAYMADRLSIPKALVREETEIKALTEQVMQQIGEASAE